MSQRAARSTRAQAPVYAEQAAAAGAARNSHSGGGGVGASSASDDESDDGEGGRQRRRSSSRSAATATAAAVRLAHADPLKLSRDELIAHTRNMLQWRDEDEEEEGAAAMSDENAAAAVAESTQLDTRCLASMLSSVPGESVRALYALELAEEGCDEMGGTIDRAMATSEAEEQLVELVRVLRAWNALAATAAAPAAVSASASAGQDDLWSLLRAAHIAPRSLVTFCFLLCGAAHGVRRASAFLGGALYLALVEHAARTGFALSSILQEVVLRRVQTNVRAWARQDARNKEAGIQRRKVRGSNAAASSGADPFGDNDAGGHAGAGEEEAEQAAWMASPTAAAFVADYLAACTRLFGPTAPAASGSAAVSTRPALGLAKHAELHSHLVDTLLDVTRTDVEVSKRGAKSSSADVDSGTSAAAAAGSSPLPAAAFECLLLLLHPAHGAPIHSLQLLLKHVLSSALLSFGPGGSSSGGAGAAASVPRHLLRVHRGAVAFVRRLAAQSALLAPVAEVQRALHHFLQHFLLRAADRADFRKLVTAAVVRDLLSGTGAAEQGGLWGGLRASTVAFVGRMARNKRPAVRLMAIEVAEAAVQTAWSLAETAAPPSSSAAQAQPPSRRSSFAEKLREADEEEEEGADAQGPRGSRASLGGASVAGQGAQDQDAPMQLEDDSPAGQARADALPLASQLLALLLGRCSDASPTVRARGLAALAHVLSYCAGAFTSRDDAPGSLPDAQKQKERAVFARVLAGRMAGPLAGTGTATAPPTPSASLSRSRSAPAPAQSPSQAAAGVAGTPLHHSKSFTFMQTPLQATLHSQSQSQGGDLSFTVCDSPGGALGLGFEPMAQQLPAFHPAQAGVRDILAVLYRRSADEKALVRRAALQALECILLGAAAEDPAAAAGADASWTEEPTAVPSTPAAAAALPSSSPSLLACLTASDLQIFYDGCFDRSLSIRKQASASLTALLQRYCSVRWPADAVAAAALGNLQRVWLGAVLPLVHDRERTVADACVAAVRDLLVTPAFACLAAAHGGPTGGRKTSAGALARAAAASAAAEQSRGDSHSVWHLFGAMDGEMLHYFQLVFLQLLRGGAVPPESLRSLLKEIQAQCAAPAEAAAGAEGPVAAEKMEDKKPASSAGGMGTGMLVAAGSASDRARACWVLLECACMASGSASAATGRVDLTGAVHAAWLRITASPGSAPLRLDQASLLRLLSCVGHLSNAGLWVAEQAGGFARVLAASIKAQVRSPAVLASKVTASPGAADVASAELIKKQVWILNSLCAASSSSTSSATGKKSASGVASGAQLQAGWEAEVLAECEKRLEAFVHAASTATTTAATGSGSGTPWNEPALHCVLFTLGEVVLQHQSYHAKTTLPPAALHLVQTFVAPTMRRGQARGGKYAAAAAAEAEAAKVKDESMMSDATLSLSLSLNDSANASASNSVDAEVMVLPPSLRAHAFLCLGKLCLRNEILAKRSIALLVSELECPPALSSPLVQNNVLLILCDLCRTYTAVVDPYLGSITALLASPNPLLRKHTVLVLNVLLQEEYLKLRGASHATATNVGGGGGAGAGGDDATGALAASAGGQQGSGSSSMLYRYLRCLVDEDESIRQLVQVSLGSVLGSSAPAGTSSAAGAAGPVQATRMHMHFIELVFFLNQCREHPIYNQFGGEATRTGAQGKGGKKGAAAATAAAAVRGSSSDAAFGLVGPLGSVNASKRFVLYRHCLSLLSDEQKFALATKMHQEVLLPVAEDALLTSPWHKGLGVEDVVQDVLIVLASEQMQLGGTGSAAAGKARGGDGVEAVEQELQELALAAEEAGESAGASAAAVAPGSKAAAHSAATAHAQAAAKAKLLHKLLKKTTMESCLPVLLELRTALLRVHSPLHKWLMHLLAALQSRHKAELEELFAGNMLLAREVAYDLRRWGDERAGAAAEEAQRWTRLDFTPRRGAALAAPMASPPSSAAAALRAASDAGAMRGAAAGREADVARRLSMGAAVQSTPLKSSSLSSLRMSGIGEMSTPLRMGSAVAAASPAGFMSPSLRRAASTPMATAAAAAAAALATPSSLRTPGGAAAVMPTPVLLRRMPSTPLPPSGAHARGQLTKRTRRSQGSTTPSQLLAAAAAVSDADSDASTDEDDDAHVIGVVRMPALDSSAAAAPPSVATSSLSSLRLSSGGGAMPTAAPWNVAIRDPNDPEPVATAAPSAKGRKAASNKGKAGAKGKQSVAAITPAPSALPSSSLDQLSAGGKKRKHQSPKQPLKSAADEEAEEEETAAAAAATATSTRTRPKRKASGLK